MNHGKPLIFGKNRDKGIRLSGDGLPEVVSLDEVKEDDLVFHDERAEDPSLAFRLARMRWPQLPEPMGVFRCIDAPVYDHEVQDQLDQVIDRQGAGDLEKLFNSGDTWEVK